jgi:nucleotide-binding universal stress UspA family protein
MEKIVVTTDFSTNSNAGIVYAANLAKARNAELIVLHIYTVLRASFWSDGEYNYYIKRYKDTLEAELATFVRPFLQSVNLSPEALMLEAHHNFDIVDGVLEYAETHQCAYICISTRGAGGLRKLFGGNTSKLIIHSKIPVLCIPSGCSYKEIKHVLYLTDLTAYKKELAKVVAFASPLHANIEMLHFYYSYDSVPDKEYLERTLRNECGYEVHIAYRGRNADKSMLEEINEEIERLPRSLVVMFTDQKKSFFEKFLLLSNAREYSFYGKTPLLTFNKLD